jgi:hypothetical protein
MSPSPVRAKALEKCRPPLRDCHADGFLHGHHFRLLDRLDDGWKPY